MFGLTQYQVQKAKNKIASQKAFLEKHYIKVGTDNLSLASFTKNAYINSDRYIAEVNHRVWSLYHYAKNHNLRNIFLTITLPSEYHPKIKNRYKNPKFINDDEHTSRAGARELSKIYKKLLDLRAYKNIDKEDKCYFRVYEPHKDGTPHLHSSIFVPEHEIDNVVESFKRWFKTNYPNLQFKIETNINNPVAYLMKYILKTFDDLRDKSKDITHLSLWYLSHRITRFYTSQTLISLDVYRRLKGRYSLLELTKMYQDKIISVFLNSDTRAVTEVYHNKMGIPIYEKRYIQQEYKPNERINLKYKKKTKPLKVRFTDTNGITYNFIDGKLVKPLDIKPVCKYSDMSLYQHFRSMDSDSSMDFDIKHYGVVKNELIGRGFIDGEVLSLNDYNYEFDYGF